MPSTICGWCGVHSNMSLKIVENGEFPDGDSGMIFGLYKCDHCSSCSLGHAEVSMGRAMHVLSPRGQLTFEAVLDLYAGTGEIRWLPQPGGNLELDYTPNEIAEAAREAQACLQAGYRRAAVQLARSVVEATAKHEGITVKGIFPKIEEMFEQRLIREHVRDGAHEVRHLGNDMAHGDFTEPVTAEDAKMVLLLMHEVLVEVYEGPGRVRNVRERREAKQQNEP